MVAIDESISPLTTSDKANGVSSISVGFSGVRSITGGTKIAPGPAKVVSVHVSVSVFCGAVPS